MAHFIIDNATIYNPVNTVPEPEDGNYNEIDGFWVTGSSNILVSENGFNNLTTKKADCETGEDQKGE